MFLPGRDLHYIYYYCLAGASSLSLFTAWLKLPVSLCVLLPAELLTCGLVHPLGCLLEVVGFGTRALSPAPQEARLLARVDHAGTPDAAFTLPFPCCRAAGAKEAAGGAGQ